MGLNFDNTKPQLQEYFSEVRDELYPGYSGLRSGDGGLDDCITLIREKEDEWLNSPLNIAIIGRSGTGKSSFINTMMGVRSVDKDRGAAATGVTETTMDPQSYPHPDNKQMVMWDLPGVGTPRYPKESYLDRVRFNEYDCFVIISADRFTDDDAYIGAEIQKRGKICYYARTKIGLSVKNSQRSHPKTHNEASLLASIRSETELQLQKFNETAKVFLIDNHLPYQFDLSNLIETMLADFPKNKRHTLVLALGSLSESIIRIKAKTLRESIIRVSLLSAAVAAVPIPGLSFSCDLALFIAEALRYRSQLSVNESLLKQFNQQTRDNLWKNFMDRIVNSLGANPFVRSGIIELLKFAPILATLTAAEEIVKYFPFVGQVAALAISGYTMQRTLHKILDAVEESAIEYFREAVGVVVQG